MGEMEWQRGHGVDTTEEPLPARTAAACPLAAELARPPPGPLRGAPSPAPATSGSSIMTLRKRATGTLGEQELLQLIRYCCEAL